MMCLVLMQIRHWDRQLISFFYDTIKILLLLLLISIIMGIINAYFPIERLREYLVSRKLYGLQ